MEAANAGEAEARARDMCERVLANPVMEDFHLTVEAA
jgi:phosphoribosylformylglycinamidine (FGAM) synthase PurS component